MKKQWEVISSVDNGVVVTAERVSFWAQVRGKSEKAMAKIMARDMADSVIGETLTVRAV